MPNSKEMNAVRLTCNLTQTIASNNRLHYMYICFAWLLWDLAYLCTSYRVSTKVIYRPSRCQIFVLSDSLQHLRYITQTSCVFVDCLTRTCTFQVLYCISNSLMYRHFSSSFSSHVFSADQMFIAT